MDQMDELDLLTTGHPDRRCMKSEVGKQTHKTGWSEGYSQTKRYSTILHYICLVFQRNEMCKVFPKVKEILNKPQMQNEFTSKKKINPLCKKLQDILTVYSEEVN